MGVKELDLENAIDFIEGLDDQGYDDILNAFEKEQKYLNHFVNEMTEDLDGDDQMNDVLTIVIILYRVYIQKNPDMFIVSEKLIHDKEEEQMGLIEEMQEIARTSELLSDEDISTTFIPNKAIHDFVKATLDPKAEDSPFDEQNSEKAYHIVKISVDCLEEVSS